MDILTDIVSTLLVQFQKPTLAFLIGGMMLAALGSKLEIPPAIYKFIVIVLLMKVGLGAGMSVREADFVSLLVPAMGAAAIGIIIVLIGGHTLGNARGISKTDGFATAGLFGAVSASTLAASMAMLDGQNIAYEGFIGALYPFMDMAALITAIILAKLSEQRAVATYANADATMTIGGGNKSSGATRAIAQFDTALARAIMVDTLRSPAISALLLGLTIGLFAQPAQVYESFYEPLFRGLLSILMLIMGMEAWARLSEMRKVAHVYIIYALIAPLAHGLLGFGVGMLAHHMTGFSAGGVILLAVMAASSSDISGPPTLRAALPKANPSAYIGASTGIGTPVAILSIPIFIALADALIGL